MNLKRIAWPLLLLLAVLSLGACSNDDDNYLPPNKEVVNELYRLYPSAQNVEWEQKGVYYAADCNVQGAETTVWIDANANWVQTETAIYQNAIPASVYTSFIEGAYGSWAIDETTLLTFPEGDDRYVIEVEQGNKELMLFYSIYGGLLHEEDITHIDDTLWPNMYPG